MIIAYYLGSSALKNMCQLCLVIDHDTNNKQRNKQALKLLPLEPL